MFDLGIVPINLNMIQKDVGLFHILFNRTLYNEFIKNKNLHTDYDKTTNTFTKLSEK